MKVGLAPVACPGLEPGSMRKQEPLGAVAPDRRTYKNAPSLI
jgi:hypothetical protein